MRGEAGSIQFKSRRGVRERCNSAVKGMTRVLGVSSDREESWVVYRVYTVYETPVSLVPHRVPLPLYTRGVTRGFGTLLRKGNIGRVSARSGVGDSGGGNGTSTSGLKSLVSPEGKEYYVYPNFLPNFTNWKLLKIQSYHS